MFQLCCCGAQAGYPDDHHECCPWPCYILRGPTAERWQRAFDQRLRIQSKERELEYAHLWQDTGGESGQEG